jgi:hypothetical protein
MTEKVLANVGDITKLLEEFEYMQLKTKVTRILRIPI